MWGPRDQTQVVEFVGKCLAEPSHRPRDLCLESLWILTFSDFFFKRVNLDVNDVTKK